MSDDKQYITNRISLHYPLHTLIALDVMFGLCCRCSISRHNVIIHESRSKEQAKTSGTTQNTSDNVFR